MKAMTPNEQSGVPQPSTSQGVTPQNVTSLMTEEERDALAQLKALDPQLTAQFDDHFLSYFVFARKLEPDRALALLKNNLEWQEKYGVKNGLDYDAIERMRDTGVMNFAPPHIRDPHGRGIGYMWPANIKPEHLETIQDLNTMMHTNWLFLRQAYADCIDNMRHGFVYVEDFRGVSFGDLMKMSGGDSHQKEMFAAIQDHLPARFRKFYLVNCPWWIRFPMAIAKPFMKERLRRKFAIVTEKELLEELGPDAVPQQLGGHLDMEHCNQMDVWIARSKEEEKHHHEHHNNE